MDILNQVIDFTSQHIRESVPDKYVFHDLQHTESVVQASIEIGVQMDCSPAELEILEIAAWFHDIGYADGAQGHEQRGAAIAKIFLEERAYPPEKIIQIERCILSTKMPQNPHSKLECILCDADLSHLGQKTYWERSSLLRQEFTVIKQEILNEKHVP